MAKAEWGSKRSCPECGSRFYDLGKDDPVVCISCGHGWRPEPLLKSKQPEIAPRKPEPKKAPAESDEDSDDDLDDGDDDLDDADDDLDDGNDDLDDEDDDDLIPDVEDDDDDDVDLSAVVDKKVNSGED